jgi:hypothetical protein
LKKNRRQDAGTTGHEVAAPFCLSMMLHPNPAIWEAIAGTGLLANLVMDF